MSQRRITIVNNSNPDQAKILIIPLNLAIQQFLLLATQKLAFKAKRLYLADGQEIDDVEYLHDGDVIYVSGGEPFFKASAKKKEPNVPTYAVAVMGPGSVGKCFARGTEVRLYNGELRAVERVVDGDVLMGDDSQPRMVTPGSLVRGRAVMYTITPAWDGASAFTVNAAHTLVLAINEQPAVKRLERTVDGIRQRCWRARWFAIDGNNALKEVVRRCASLPLAQSLVDEQLKQWRPLTWEVSVEGFLRTPPRLRRVCMLVAAAPVTFVNDQRPGLEQVMTRILNAPPSSEQLHWVAWYLGLCVTGRLLPKDSKLADPPQPAGQRLSTLEILAELQRYTDHFPEQTAQTPGGTSAVGDAVCAFQAVAEASVPRLLLRHYQSLERSDCAQALLCDSVELRRRFFAGVIDGEGRYLEEENAYEIDSDSVSVAQRLRTIAASLGLRCSRVAERNAADVKARACTSYRIHVSGDMWDVVQYCRATYNRFPRPDPLACANAERRPLCYGFSVSPQPVADYFGFAVHGGANRRFLLADFTVTHNSAMTRRYVQGVFVTDYDPTIEDAYRKNVTLDSSPCILDILDTAGQEDYTALRSTWMRERDGFLLVFSLTDRSTFQGLLPFVEQLASIHEEEDEASRPPVIVVGNKSDLQQQREVRREEGERWSKEYGNGRYVECSALTGEHVEACFGELIREIRRRRKGKEKREREKRKSWCTIL